jgi:putative endonuclease
MGDPRHRSGLDAERVAADWLASSGWQVLAQRHRTPAGEIDLVALDPRRCLVAVEVRFRRSARAGSAAESVQPRKVHRLRSSVAAYARDEAVAHDGLRVDLVTVEPGPAPGTWRLCRLPGVDAW